MSELEIAKKIITDEVEREGLRVVQIILFGSRAKGNFSPDSDWDFLIVLDKDLSFSEVKFLTGRIQLRLAEKKIPNDIILRGISQFEKSRKSVGNISYYVAKEGIVI